MKKTYVKPVIAAKEQRAASMGACGRMSSAGCGKLVLKTN